MYALSHVHAQQISSRNTYFRVQVCLSAPPLPSSSRLSLASPFTPPGPALRFYELPPLRFDESSRHKRSCASSTAHSSPPPRCMHAQSAAQSHSCDALAFSLDDARAESSIPFFIRLLVPPPVVVAHAAASTPLIPIATATADVTPLVAPAPRAIGINDIFTHSSSPLFKNNNPLTHSLTVCVHTQRVQTRVWSSLHFSLFLDTQRESRNIHTRCLRALVGQIVGANRD